MNKEEVKFDNWYKIKKGIEQTDKIIDQKIYKLHDFGPREIKVIEVG